MKNKKLIMILIGIIIIIILGLVIYKFINYSKYQKGNRNLKVIAEDSYFNWAWGFQYNGKAILSDGTIVKWNCTSDYSSYKVETIKEKSDYILENCTITGEKVLEKDFKNINKFIGELDDIFEHKSSGGADMGAHCIKVYDYQNSEILTLLETGDSVGENPSDTAKQLIEIINKYL